jgi:uncharacterized protein (DUF2141 family)
MGQVPTMSVWQANMRFAAVLMLGVATAASAAAQSRPAASGFVAMPDKLPMLLFAPDSLAGTLLRPLAQANATGLPEVQPEPASAAALTAAPDDTVAMAVAQADSSDPSQDAEPAAAPPPTEDPAEAAEPETAVENTPAPAPEAPAADPNASSVTVIVENVESASGNVNVAVCDKDLSREGCPYVREVPAAQGFVETEFKGIPPGTYAVVGYHDVNGNDTFDKLFGMPREPYALSSKAADKLVPTFADAALTIKSGENAVIIRLKRLGG